MKIRMKLILSTLSIVLLILAISMGTIYRNYKINAEKTALNLTLTTAREYSYRIEEIFNEIVYTAKDLDMIIKNKMESNQINNQDLTDLFDNFLKSHENIYNIGIILNNNYTAETDLAYNDNDYQSILISKDGVAGSAVPDAKQIDIGAIFKDKKNILAEPIKYNAAGNELEIISLFWPVESADGNSVLIRIDLPVSVLQKITESITIFDSGFARILSNSGYVVTHKNPKRVGDIAGEIKKGKPETVKKVTDALQNGKEYNAFSYSASTKSEVFKSLTPINILDVDEPWAFGTIVTKDDIYSGVNQLTKIIMLTIIISVFVIIIAMIVLSGVITKPIVQATNYTSVVSELDFTHNLPEKALMKKDETGEMLKSFKKLKDNIKNIVGNINESSVRVTKSSDELKEITASFSTLTKNISDTVALLATRAKEQASNTADGALKVNQLGDSIELVNQKICDMKNIIVKVNNIVSSGDRTVSDLIEINKDNNAAAAVVYKVIHDTNSLVEKIASSSEQIAKIADQTNLLALNAAIESERAGEAGKGFSVVAEEIRKLAEESSKLTDEISSVITNLREQSEKSVDSIEAVSKTTDSQKKSVQLTRTRFNAIQDKISEIRQAIDILFEAGNDSNDKKEEIMAVLNNLSKFADDNAISAQETSASTEKQGESLNMIGTQIVSLNELAVNLNSEINKFKF